MESDDCQANEKLHRPLPDRAAEQAKRSDRFRDLLARISNRFVAARFGEIESIIRQCMQEIAELYQVDRLSMWWLDRETQTAQGVLQVGYNAKAREELVEPFSRLPWLIETLYSGHGRPVVYPDEVPSDAFGEYDFFAENGVKSCVLIPLEIRDEIVGLGSVAAIRQFRQWSDCDKTELSLLFHSLGSAWIRHRADEKIVARENDLGKRVVFQTRLADILAQFASSTSDDARDLVDGILIPIANDYGFERASLWMLNHRARCIQRVHEWAADDAYRTDSAVYRISDVPWLVRRLLNGEYDGPLLVPEGIPANAVEDRNHYEKRGVKSGLIFPIVIEGHFSAVFGVSTLTEKRRWNKREKSELTLLTHTVSSAWLRHESERRARNREKNLLRSQRVAHVGSFSVFASDAPPICEANAVVRLSEEAGRIFDIPPGQETLELMLSRLHPDDRSRVYHERSKSVEDGSGLTLDYRIVRRDGSVVYVEDRAEVDRDESGQVVRVFGTFQDVTERELAKEKLERALAEIRQLKDRLQAENVVLREEVRAARSFEFIVGDSKAMRSALVAVEKVARTDIAVLILGETGTGKELIARSVHSLSDRSKAAMISVNCAALTTDLIESELFGHEKGSFTGAHKQRKGRFELADRGTLFLDEIGDLPLSVQAKLLRVLQTGEFERIGGTQTMKVDVRVVAATNKNLSAMVEDGSFRADLFYRINGFPIRLPALRHRPEDIPGLAHFFVNKHAERLGKGIRSISAAMLDNLCTMPWPGNVRELEGYIQRALISSEGPTLDYREWQHPFDDAGAAGGAPTTVSRALTGPATRRAASAEDCDDLDSIQRNHICSVLARRGWVIDGENGAAAALGLPPSSLRSRMKRLGISRPRSTGA